MTLAMARCIGRSGCGNAPSAGRGLCVACYARHRNHGTIVNFPTMRERTAQLRANRMINTPLRPDNARFNAEWRKRNYAERVDVGGVLIHPRAPHGRTHAYNAYGCRGAMCNAARVYYKHLGSGHLDLPQDIRGFSPTLLDCAYFDIETFVGAYL